MAWKELPSQVKAEDIKKNPEKIYEGVYLGSKQITTTYGKNNVYKFRGSQGVFAIFGFTHLDMVMENANLGMHLRIQYAGTKEAKNSPSGFMHQVRVEVLEDETQPEPDDDFTPGSFGRPDHLPDLPLPEESADIPF